MHCVGFTQLVSAFYVDKSTFIGVINMPEQETKKKKDCKEEIDGNKFIEYKCLLSNTYLSNVFNQSRKNCKNVIEYQFLIGNTTLPPYF